MNSEQEDGTQGVEADVWSEWLRHHRHANDPACAQVVQAVVEGYANRVLDGAQLAVGMTLVDFGGGDGLVRATNTAPKTPPPMPNAPKIMP